MKYRDQHRLGKKVGNRRAKAVKAGKAVSLIVHSYVVITQCQPFADNRWCIFQEDRM